MRSGRPRAVLISQRNDERLAVHHETDVGHVALGQDRRGFFGNAALGVVADGGSR